MPSLELVARQQLAVDRLQLGVVDRRRHVELTERAMQPREVAREVDQLAVEHRRHLVDAVGEQEAAVEHADLRLLLRQ